MTFDDLKRENQPQYSQSLICSRYSELLVGAPFFSDDLHPEQGRVYLYDNKGSGDLRLSAKLPEAFSSDRWRANFGRAIAAVGDIDLDGFQGTEKSQTKTLEEVALFKCW